MIRLIGVLALALARVVVSTGQRCDAENADSSLCFGPIAGRASLVQTGVVQHSTSVEIASTDHPCGIEPDASILCVEGGTVQTLHGGMFEKVVVEGKLQCPTGSGNNVRLHTSLLEVRNGGVFECGTSTEPVRGRVEIFLVGEDRSVQVLHGGVLRLHGDLAKSGRHRLAKSAKQGDDEIHMRDAVQGSWEVGDVVVVATTSFHKQLEKQWEDPSIDRLGQNEVRTITKILGGKSVRLSEPLKYFHFAERPETFIGSELHLDEAAYVVNLNRSIYLKAPAGDGGDLKVLLGGSLFASAVEIANFGVAGEMGRYPFHWHKGGDVHGQYIKASSIHDSHQRCIVIHGTFGARIEGNTCFNFFGHGIFLEDGDEVHNVVSGNTVILAKKPLPKNVLLESEILDVVPTRFPAPSSYWIAHPENTFTDNVAIASEGSGFWNAFVKDLCCNAKHACEMKVKRECHAPARYVSPIRSPTIAFNNNIAASCMVGMNWDAPPIGELTGNPRNPSHDRHLVPLRYQPSGDTPTFRGNVIYKSSNMAMYVRSTTIIFDEMVMADNGFGHVFAYNNVLKDSLVVGWSANAEVDFFTDKTVRLETRRYQHRASFFNLYDGPFVLDNVHVAGFPTESVFQDNQPDLEITPIVFVPVGALDRSINLAKKVTFEGGLKPRKMFFDFFQSSSLYYNDGGSQKAIVSDHPFNYDSSCHRNTMHGTTNLECPNMSLAFLVFRVPPANDKPYHNVRIVRSTDSNPICDNCPTYDTFEQFPEAIRKFVQLIMFKGYRYHITIPDMHDAHETYQFKADTLGTLSPIFYFDHSQHCDTAVVGLRQGGVAALTRVSSEEQLNAATSDVVHYMSSGRLAVRVKATEKSHDVVPGYAGSPTAYMVKFFLQCTSAFQRYTRAAYEETPRILGSAIKNAMQANGRIRSAGWACAVGKSDPLEIDVQVNGTSIGTVPANRAGGPGITTLCQDGSGHRFDKYWSDPLHGKYDYEVKVVAKYGQYQKLLKTYIQPSMRKLLFSEWLADHRATRP